MKGFPYTSAFVLASLIVAILSIPFVKGQTSGLVAGAVLLVFFEAAFTVMKMKRARTGLRPHLRPRGLAAEFSEELAGDASDKEKNG